MKKKIYARPTLIEIGKIIKKTQGQSGSALDGNGTLTQTASGNNDI